MNIKRIIKEELSKILEGDVIRPKFGGNDEEGNNSKKSSRLYLDILEKVGSMLIDSIDSMSDEMEESEIANLNDLLDKIEDMQGEHGREDEAGDEDDFEDEDEDEDEDDDDSRGLSGFKDYMNRFDRDETD
jgi:hypothetical protein